MTEEDEVRGDLRRGCGCLLLFVFLVLVALSYGCRTTVEPDVRSDRYQLTSARVEFADTAFTMTTRDTVANTVRLELSGTSQAGVLRITGQWWMNLRSDNVTYPLALFYGPYSGTYGTFNDSLSWIEVRQQDQGYILWLSSVGCLPYLKPQPVLRCTYLDPGNVVVTLEFR